MRIPCPFCGERDVSEFHYLGSARPRRPDADAADAKERFVDYVYVRDNPAGAHEELWYHGFGCRSWLVVSRNTLTHEIGGARHAAQTGTNE
jgi:methylglutamate dehydrogenase subunit B